MASSEAYYCEKCQKTMRTESFYGTNNLIKYPEGKLKQCKACITMHVDNWNPDTYLWILQEIDIPWVPEEWHKLMATYGKDKEKLTGTSILGRYVSKMKLKQWKDYRWKDTEFLQEQANAKIEETMKRQGYSAAQIAEVINKGTFTMPEGELSEPEYAAPAQADFLGQPSDDYFGAQTANIEEELVEDLTEEDKKYLCIKWGKAYKPNEWIALEQLFEEMMHSYDIQAAGDINTLKLACKCSLKANQLLDIGDIDGAQKTTKMYDSLMKSGKWTAAQIKEDESEVVDSIGELVAMCERDGFIPRYYVDTPNDKADYVIKDLQQYTHDLIDNEVGLSSMIEAAVKQWQEEQVKIKEAAEMSSEDEEARLMDYDIPVLQDEDFSDFKDFELDLENEDSEFYKSLLEGEDE